MSTGARRELLTPTTHVADGEVKIIPQRFSVASRLTSVLVACGIALLGVASLPAEAAPPTVTKTPIGVPLPLTLAQAGELSDWLAANAALDLEPVFADWLTSQGYDPAVVLDAAVPTHTNDQGHVYYTLNGDGTATIYVDDCPIKDISVGYAFGDATGSEHIKFDASIQAKQGVDPTIVFSEADLQDILTGLTIRGTVEPHASGGTGVAATVAAALNAQPLGFVIDLGTLTIQLDPVTIPGFGSIPATYPGTCTPFNFTCQIQNLLYEVNNAINAAARPQLQAYVDEVTGDLTLSQILSYIGLSLPTVSFEEDLPLAYSFGYAFADLGEGSSVTLDPAEIVQSSYLNYLNQSVSFTGGLYDITLVDLLGAEAVQALQDLVASAGGTWDPSLDTLGGALMAGLDAVLALGSQNPITQAILSDAIASAVASLSGPIDLDSFVYSGVTFAPTITLDWDTLDTDALAVNFTAKAHELLVEWADILIDGVEVDVSLDLTFTPGAIEHVVLTGIEEEDDVDGVLMGHFANIVVGGTSTLPRLTHDFVDGSGTSVAGLSTVPVFASYTIGNPSIASFNPLTGVITGLAVGETYLEITSTITCGDEVFEFTEVVPITVLPVDTQPTGTQSDVQQSSTSTVPPSSTGTPNSNQLPNTGSGDFSSVLWVVAAVPALAAGFGRRSRKAKTLGSHEA
jgi:hypothetical protein